jgi:predicted DNA-binding WGR domain protein
MNKKWALLKNSDCGPMNRGQSGKKKVYEVTVTGNTLICSWGMAEKVQRQTSTQTFITSQRALAAAYEKVNSKIDRGYEVAYSV